MSTLNPVDPRTRIHAIDAVRGMALLGIFLVNIQIFGEPFGKMILHAPAPGESLTDAAAFYFVRVFCEGKFYPLFSLLFGMGIALQWGRAREAGRKFLAVGLRRMLVLMALGLLHAALVWYGDILFVYSTTGLVLVLLVKAKVRTLLTLAGVFFGVSIVLGVAMFTLMNSGEAQTVAERSAPTPHFDDPYREWIKGFENDQMNQGPVSRLWLDTETQAYREGPYLQLFLFRISSWAFMLVFFAMSIWWHVLAMFMLGAALLKHGIFQPERRPLRRRLLVIGMAVGLPLCIAAALLGGAGGFGEVAGAVLTMAAGPLVSLAYLSGISLLVDSGRCRLLTRSLANVGRMALTNYLLQSLIATTIFYFYGFGLFGETSRSQRVLIVLGVYAAQVALSAAWLRVFAYGPMEWLWRSLTYLRLQPMVRRARSPEPG